MMSRLQHMARLLQKGEELILAFLLASMILLAGSQIVLRNLFDSGIDWAEPLLRLLVLWVGMLGAMLATHDDKHIRIDVVSRYLSPGKRRVSYHITELVSAVVAALLAYYSARFVYFEWQDGTEAFNGMPAWLAEVILPIGFSVMALRFALHTVIGMNSEKENVA